MTVVCNFSELTIKLFKKFERNSGSQNFNPANYMYTSYVAIAQLILISFIFHKTIARYGYVHMLKYLIGVFINAETDPEVSPPTNHRASLALSMSYSV